MMPDLTTTQELPSGAFALTAFNALCFRDDLMHVRRSRFPVSDLTLAKLRCFGAMEAAEESRDDVGVVLRPEPQMLIYLHSWRGNCEITVAGIEREAVDTVTADMVASLRDPEPAEDEVPVVFWGWSAPRPISARRRIAAPSWNDVQSNYNAETRAQLDQLMAAGRGGGPGGLILWHGEPGTGKSYALRALARAWRPWCDTHIITDADAFLGGSISYLMESLLRSADDRWALIVLEDAGELLRPDAGAVTGQALSRLLNLTDGLLGEGMRTIVLVTTNEPLARLHPAVARPGRAWAEVEFAALSVEGADAWLSDRDCAARAGRAMTLAELFALLGGRVPAQRGVGVGFAA